MLEDMFQIKILQEKTNLEFKQILQKKINSLLEAQQGGVPPSRRPRVVPPSEGGPELPTVPGQRPRRPTSTSPIEPGGADPGAPTWPRPRPAPGQLPPGYRPGPGGGHGWGRWPPTNPEWGQQNHPASWDGYFNFPGGISRPVTYQMGETIYYWLVGGDGRLFVWANGSWKPVSEGTDTPWGRPGKDGYLPAMPPGWQPGYVPGPNGTWNPPPPPTPPTKPPAPRPVQPADPIAPTQPGSNPRGPEPSYHPPSEPENPWWQFSGNMGNLPPTTTSGNVQTGMNMMANMMEMYEKELMQSVLKKLSEKKK